MSDQETSVRYRVTTPMISHAAFFESRHRTQLPMSYEGDMLPACATPAEIEHFLSMGMIAPIPAEQA